MRNLQSIVVAWGRRGRGGLHDCRRDLIGRKRGREEAAGGELDRGWPRRCEAEERRRSLLEFQPDIRQRVSRDSMRGDALWPDHPLRARSRPVLSQESESLVMAS